MTYLPSVRYATIGDADAIAHLFQQVVASLDIYNSQARDGEIKKFSASKIALRIENDPFAVTVACLGSDFVGFAITDDQHGPIWLEWYGVVPNARRQNIGKILLLSLIEQCSVRHATKIWCDTRVNNIPSIKLFEKLGFKRLCDLDNHWYGQDFFLWERKI